MTVKLRGFIMICVLLAIFVLVSGCNPQMRRGLIEIGGPTGVSAATYGVLNALGVGDTGKIVGTIGGVFVGVVLANMLNEYLDEKDSETHAKTREKALTTGESHSWSNPETGASGSSTVTETRKIEQEKEIIVYKDKIVEIPAIDVIGESYRVKKSVNVRSGPGTDYDPPVGSLSVNSVVNVMGKVRGKNWYMISQNGIGSGFVHADYLEAAPQTELTKLPKIEMPTEKKKVETSSVCSTVVDNVRAGDGRSNETKTNSCKGTSGWEAAPDFES